MKPFQNALFDPVLCRNTKDIVWVAHEDVSLIDYELPSCAFPCEENEECEFDPDLCDPLQIWKYLPNQPRKVKGVQSSLNGKLAGRSNFNR